MPLTQLEADNLLQMPKVFVEPDPIKFSLKTGLVRLFANSNE